MGEGRVGRFGFLSLVCLTTFFSTSAIQAVEEKELTVLIYAVSDEGGGTDIEEPTLQSLKRFERIRGLKDGRVNVIVQHDRTGLDPNHRFALSYVERPNAKNPGPDTPFLPEPVVDRQEAALSAALKRRVRPFRYGERDSGNPVTLKKFLEWGAHTFPARHYAIILMGHAWGTQGMLQDFFVGKRALKKSTMIKNYELRRAIQEVLGDLKRTATNPVPRNRFDLLVMDACIPGQLDVLAEWEGLFTYFIGSALETPFNSVAFEEVFSPYVDWLNGPGDKSRAWEIETEKRLLKPFVREFVESHARGGKMALIEGQYDVVQSMAIRLDNLAPVRRALAALVDEKMGMPRETRDAWREGKLVSLEAARDSDSYGDLWEIADRFAKLDGTKALGAALKKTLNAPAVDPTHEAQRVRHDSAIGAWAHVRVDDLVKARDLAACIGLKYFAMSNSELRPVPLPRFHDEDGNRVTAHALYCDGLLHAQQEKQGKLKVKPVFDRSTPVRSLFGARVGWGRTLPAYLTEVKGEHGTVAARYLSVWLPRQGRKLDVAVRLRFPASDELMLSFVEEGTNPLSVFEGADRVARWKKEKHIRFPASVVFDDMGPGLYVTEAHTNGTPFKRGIGILFTREVEKEESSYQGGRDPIEKDYPHWQLERYMGHLKGEKKLDVFAIRGAEFYRAHKIASTGWPEFLFGGGGENGARRRQSSHLREFRREAQSIE